MSAVHIPFRLATIGDQTVRAVDSRELHRLLEVQTVHRNWIRRRVEDAHLVEHFDFEVSLNSGRNPKGGRPDVSYLLTSDACKHIAMLEGTEIGHRIRVEFIEAEKRERAGRAGGPRLLNGVEIGIQLENHDRQRDASKQFAKVVGNKAEIIDDRTRACQLVSTANLTPAEVREVGRHLGLKGRACESAPAVWRAFGLLEAPVYSAIMLMRACGVSLPEAARRLGDLRTHIGGTRDVFTAAGCDLARVQKMPREEFDRALGLYEERRRAAETMPLFPEN